AGRAVLCASSWRLVFGCLGGRPAPTRPPLPAPLETGPPAALSQRGSYYERSRFEERFRRRFRHLRRSLLGILLVRQEGALLRRVRGVHRRARSEEHTSELQSRENLVCRL